MRNRLVLVAGLLLAAASAVTAWDVKETVRITVSAESIAQSVTLDDPSLLAGSNVFVGRFIGGPSGPPDARLPQFRLSFDIQTLHGVKHDAYVLYYAKGEAPAQGYIYVPGKQDSEYRRNGSTILRDGVDGTWRHAEPNWASTLNTLLPVSNAGTQELRNPGGKEVRRPRAAAWGSSPMPQSQAPQP